MQYMTSKVFYCNITPVCEAISSSIKGHAESLFPYLADAMIVQ